MSWRAGTVTLILVLSTLARPSEAQASDRGAKEDRGAPNAGPDAGSGSDSGPDGLGPQAGTDAGADAGAGAAEVKPPPAQPKPVIRITGTAVVPEDVARTAVGPPPTPGQDLHAWGEQAVQRIEDAYQARGYRYARAWFSDSKQPGVLWFDVDEGRMRVTFVGMSSITATLFRLRLNLPGGIFQKAEFERSLADQKAAFKLISVDYRVHELEGYDVTVFGQVVPARTLEIRVARRESFGWALDISVSAAWGIVPSVKYSASNLLLPGDRLLAELDMAVPYRRYVFDATPRFTWVHGGIAAAYRLPHLEHSPLRLRDLAPRLDMSVFLSQYSRADLSLSSFYLLRDVSVANLVASWHRVELSLGFGVDVARQLMAEAAPVPTGEPTPTLPADVYSVRGLTRAGAKWMSGLPWSRSDRRTFVNLLVDVCAPLEVRANLWTQYFAVWGRHRMFLRGRAIALVGNVPFWDDVELAGDYQRVFFGDLYWAQRSAQLETAYHVKLWRDWFEVGIFHDLTVFDDRIALPATTRAMDAFGPSLHFLILDQYALGIYEGVGFAPGRFNQTLSFTMQSVF